VDVVNDDALALQTNRAESIRLSGGGVTLSIRHQDGTTATVQALRQVYRDIPVGAAYAGADQNPLGKNRWNLLSVDAVMQSDEITIGGREYRVLKVTSRMSGDDIWGYDTLAQEDD
jgi:hypothetical protein